MRTHIAEECKNDYAAQLQKYNKEQSQFYFSDMPLIFNVRQRLSPVHPDLSLAFLPSAGTILNANIWFNRH